jgi:molybdopterin synthase catalytic subunit
MEPSVALAVSEANTTARLIVPPRHGDWIGVTCSVLPVDLAWSWASQPDCGGVVTFCGTVRDHSDGHPGVTMLEYESYEEQVVPRLTEVAHGARERWGDIGRLALLHRIGPMTVGEVAVVVVASTPHRAEAFAAAQYCIDTLKATVPIWKRETWRGGTDWALCGCRDEHSHGTTTTNGPPSPSDCVLQQ